MLGSNSPVDVAFFATHAEVERMWQRYALSGNMTNDTWPIGPAAGSCPGQHPAYRLVWFDYELDAPGGAAAPRSADLTNVNWRDLLNPANPAYAVHVPYVYDAFTWDHCLHYGVEGVDASLMRPDDWVWNKAADPATKHREGAAAVPHANSDLGANATAQNAVSPRAPAGVAPRTR